MKIYLLHCAQKRQNRKQVAKMYLVELILTYYILILQYAHRLIIIAYY